MYQSRTISKQAFCLLMAFAVGSACLSGGGGARCQTCFVTWAGETTKPGKQTDADQKASAARLAVMRTRALSLSAETILNKGSAPENVQIIDSPLLRYSNPAAAIVTDDATVWGWGPTGRPRILASVDQGGCEVVSLSEEPVSLTGKSGAKWSSKASDIKWQLVPNAPRPGDSAAIRVRQMKEIIARFTAGGHYDDSSRSMELRPLVRHLHRYSDPVQGILDGAIFAFTAGTNPEVFILLECRQRGKDQPPQWHYGCTRLSAGGLEARLDDKVVWTCPAIVTWDATAPYFSMAFPKEDVAVDGETKEKTGRTAD